MTRSEARDILRQYRKSRAECEALRRRIESKKNDILYIRGLCSERTPVRSGTVSDRVEAVIEMIDGMIGCYLRKCEETEAIEAGIASIIDRVSHPEGRAVLMLHYIDGYTFEEIAPMVCLSERSVWNRHNSAIDEICRRM